MLKYTLERAFKKKDYTIGRLYKNGQLLCNTIEDTDRGLTSSMPIEEIKRIKVYAKTAIPTGKYEVRYTYSPKFRRFLPILVDVPCFSGIRIHPGNTADDSAGCLLPGLNTKKGMVTNSTYYVNKICEDVKFAIDHGQIVTIEIR